MLFHKSTRSGTCLQANTLSHLLKYSLVLLLVITDFLNAGTMFSDVLLISYTGSKVNQQTLTSVVILVVTMKQQQSN